jgi:cation:H+ antiporter
MSAWVIFLLSGVVVVLAGVRLAHDGDIIAERTGLGKAWVGAILVATATSLPELATDFAAVRQGEPSLAVGDLFGSSMANMAILAGADLVLRRRRILARIAVNQTLVGLLAICVTAIAAAGVLTDGEFSLLGIGWAPFVIFGSYLGGMRLLHANRREPPFAPDGDVGVASDAGGNEAPTLLRPAIGFALAASAILAAAPFLARASADIADQLGVSAGVIGVVLLAVTTSLPEVSVTVASMRTGSYDLAVGNLLGSNCVNMALLLPLDLFDGGGPLLAGVGPSVLVSALFAILLTGQTLIEVLNTAERRIWWLDPDAALRMLTYALGIYLVIRIGS